VKTYGTTSEKPQKQLKRLKKYGMKNINRGQKMNWGLFLGCNCRHPQKGEGRLNLIDIDNLEIYEGWKPILRPLSSMTDEEKREFPDKKRKLTQARFDGEYAFLIFTKGARVARVSDILWLIEKGFYVNQCREDECIIETKE
jgi:hypothetical protein